MPTLTISNAPTYQLRYSR